MVSSAREFATPFAMLAACVWLPLFPALACAKSFIPGTEIRRLMGRAAKISLVAGLPLMFLLLFTFARMNHEPLPLGEQLGRCAAVSVAFVPLYGALIATSVFQRCHRADRAAGAARAFWVRLLAGLLILAANLLACVVMLFTLFASTGAYRGWH